MRVVNSRRLFCSEKNWYQMLLLELIKLKYTIYIFDSDLVWRMQLLVIIKG